MFIYTLYFFAGLELNQFYYRQRGSLYAQKALYVYVSFCSQAH